MSDVIFLQNHTVQQEADSVYLNNLAECLQKMSADFDEYTDYICAKLRHQFRLPTDIMASTGQNSFISDLNQIQPQLEQIKVRLESFMVFVI